MPEFTIDITREAGALLIEHGIRNFPSGVVSTVEDWLLFVANSNADSYKREKLMLQIEELSTEELDNLLNPE